MSLSIVQFQKLSEEEKFNLYSKANVDSASLDALTRKFSEALDKIQACESKIIKLESEISVNRSANVALKKQLNRLDQYGRKENLIVTGVPENVQGLEGKIIKVMNMIDVPIVSNDIVDCHPVNRKGNVIVRFGNRKNVDLILKARKKLKDINTALIWGENCIHYINRNLTPVNSKLRWLAKGLKNKNILADFGVNNTGIWVKKSEFGEREQVDIEEDMLKFIPDGMSLKDFS